MIMMKDKDEKGKKAGKKKEKQNFFKTMNKGKKKDKKINLILSHF